METGLGQQPHRKGALPSEVTDAVRAEDLIDCLTGPVDFEQRFVTKFDMLPTRGGFPTSSMMG